MNSFLISLILSGSINTVDLQGAMTYAYPCTAASEDFQSFLNTKPQYRKRVWRRYLREHLFDKNLKQIDNIVKESGYLNE